VRTSAGQTRATSRVTGGSCGASLAASSNCTYAVRFTPSTETAESGTLSIGVAEDPNGGPAAVTLSGTGITPLKALPASIAFGTGPRRSIRRSRTVTVTNSGGATVTLSESITGLNAGDFIPVAGGTCGTTLARRCALHLPVEVHAEHHRRGERDARIQRDGRCGQPAQREPDRHGQLVRPSSEDENRLERIDRSAVLSLRPSHSARSWSWCQRGARTSRTTANHKPQSRTAFIAFVLI
jgi:hypothetical protein